MKDGRERLVWVERNVLEGIEAVRRSELTNMFEPESVATLAEQMGFESSAEWLRSHHGLYARALTHGFGAD